MIWSRLAHGSRSSLVILLTVALLLPAWSQPMPVQAAPVMQAALQAQTEALIAGARETAPLYADDFDAISGDWTDIYDLEVSTFYRGGQRRIAVDSDDVIVWSRLDTTYTDFYAEVETTTWASRTDDLFGIIFRYVDRDNFYYFVIGSDGFFSVRRLVNDEWSYLLEWTESDAIEVGDGAVNWVGVVAQGERITVLVNDVVLAQVEDDALAAGSVGILAGTFEDAGVEVGFDDFALWEVPPLEETPPATRRDRVPRASATETPAPLDIPATPEAPEEPTVTPDATVTAEAPATETPAPPVEATPTPVVEAELPVVADPVMLRRSAPSYQETFEVEPEGWLPTISDQMSLASVDGALTFTIDRSSVLGWSLAPYTGPDFYAEVDTLYVSDVYEAEYGILFRFIDQNNFMFYAINNRGSFSVWRLEENAWTVARDWEEVDALATGDGAENRLGVLAQGDRFELYANDVYLGEVSDDTFTGGGLALAAGTFDEPGVLVAFDNLNVWNLSDAAVAPSAEATPVPSVSGPLISVGVEEIQGWIDGLDIDLPDVMDDFRRESDDWDVDANAYGATYFAQRAYHFRVDEPESYLYGTYYGFPSGVGPGSFYGEITVRFADPASDGEAGWVVRERDSEEFYFVLIDSQGAFEVLKRVDGSWSSLTGAMQAVAWDAEADDNRLGVVSRDSLLAVVVNGQVEVALLDTSLTEGNIGLVAQSGVDAPMVVVFDDFGVWTLDE